MISQYQYQMYQYQLYIILYIQGDAELFIDDLCPESTAMNHDRLVLITTGPWRHRACL